MTSQRGDIEFGDREQRALLEAARTLQVASTGPDGWPHLVPMWFALDDDGLIVFTTYARSQKVLNLQRDPRITVLAETGHAYDELRGVMIQGEAELVVGDPQATARAMALVGARYASDGGSAAAGAASTGAAGGESTAAPSSAAPSSAAPSAAAPSKAAQKRCVVRIHPRRVRSWDHRKLTARRDGPAAAGSGSE